MMHRFINKITLLGVLLFLLVFKAHSQQVVTDLYGFRLGQFRDVPQNEFGKPMQQDKFEDGFEYEVFLAKPDTSLYMVFEYTPDQPDVIWSIQISGSNTATDLGFKNLKLGATAKQVEKILGKPTGKEAVGEHGERWEYKAANYSVEISLQGKLSSVKITDTYSGDKPDLKKLPNFKKVAATLNSPKNADIATLLAPGVEIYYKERTLSFGRPFQNEITADHSKIFATIRTISKDLNKINTANPNEYEENIRLVEGQNPLHVIKISSGHSIKEIVFQYSNGRYLVWEINAL